MLPFVLAAASVLWLFGQLDRPLLCGLFHVLFVISLDALLIHVVQGRQLL